MGDHGNDFSTRIAKHKRTLKDIEDSERAKIVDMDPPPPMLDTRKEYIEKNNIRRLNSQIDLIMKIGGKHSQFYSACHALTNVMLLRKSVKRHCVIFYGEPDSGKTWISKFMHNIFDSHWKQQPKGIFDEKISPHEANKQLVVINEANVDVLFKL